MRAETCVCFFVRLTLFLSGITALTDLPRIIEGELFFWHEISTEVVAGTDSKGSNADAGLLFALKSSPCSPLTWVGPTGYCCNCVGRFLPHFNFRARPLPV